MPTTSVKTCCIEGSLASQVTALTMGVSDVMLVVGSCRDDCFSVAIGSCLVGASLPAVFVCCISVNGVV